MDEPVLGEPAPVVESIEPEVEPPAAEPEALAEPAALAAESEDPINENRAGHLPTFHDMEHAIETPNRRRASSADIPRAAPII